MSKARAEGALGYVTALAERLSSLSTVQEVRAQVNSDADSLTCQLAFLLRDELRATGTEVWDLAKTIPGEAKTVG